MSQWRVLVVSAGLLAGCVPIGHDPAREQFGVSAVGPAVADSSAPASAAAQMLAWKIGQICTLGYAPGQKEVEAAEAGQQIVDQLLRCRPYERVSLF
jgi:hypothetical protein